MNQQPRRMHLLYVAFALLRTVKNLAFLLVLAAVRIISGDGLSASVYWTIGGVLLLLLLSGLYQFAAWRRFTYQEEEDRLVIRSGLLQRREKAIYYSRIHSVSIEQPLIQRLLGVVQLKIETPGGSSDGDAVLEVLSSAEAERLQGMLEQAAVTMEMRPGSSSEPADTTAENDDSPRNHTGDEGDGLPNSSASLGNGRRGSGAGNFPNGTASSPQLVPQLLYRLTTPQLLRAALTELNLGLGLAFIAGIYSFAGDLLPGSLVNQLMDNARGYITGIQALLGAVLIGLIFAWLLSLVLFIVKYAGFSVYRSGERLSVRYGLLERRQFVFHPKHVQAVTVKESAIRRWLGFAQIQLHVVSSGRDAKVPVLHPFIRRSEVQTLLDSVVPGFLYRKPEYRSPSRALWAYVWPGLLIGGIITAVGTYFLSMYGLLIGLVLILVIVLLDYGRYRRSGAALEGERLIIANRYVSHYTHCVLWKHIEAFSFTGSRLQRRQHLLTLRLYIAAGHATFQANRLERREAEQISGWYSRSHRAADWEQ
ncbi:PH domain-containing protein [Paenibacillus sp. Z6-24]